MHRHCFLVCNGKGLPLHHTFNLPMALLSILKNKVSLDKLLNAYVCCPHTQDSGENKGTKIAKQHYYFYGFKQAGSVHSCQALIS